MLKKKRHLKKKNIIVLLILLISIITFAFSGYYLYRWFQESKKTKEIENEVVETVEITEVDDTENTEIIEQEEIPKENPYWDYIKMKLIDIDFKELKQKNKNTKGWIQVQGTNINYPFVQTTDNDFYLTHSFDDSYNTAGWVFMDYRNKNDGKDKNTILYAHGRYDKTMFGSLKNILNSGWYHSKENHVIRLSTEVENTLWQVFSVYKIPTTNDYIQTNFSNTTQYNNLLQKIKNRSFFSFDTTVSENDRILTLSTCWDDNEKVVLHAKLIKREIRLA